MRDQFWYFMGSNADVVLNAFGLVLFILLANVGRGFGLASIGTTVCWLCAACFGIALFAQHQLGSAALTAFEASLYTDLQMVGWLGCIVLIPAGWIFSVLVNRFARG